MNERIDLSRADDAQGNNFKPDAAGFRTYDFYAVVPSTAVGGKLNFKLGFGREQQPGHIDIENLSVQEVASAPGLNPADAIEAYERDSAREQQRTPFMIGANGNHLVDANTRMPDNDLDKVVRQAQADHPGDLQAQLKEVNASKTDYLSEHKFSEQDKEKYLQEMKAMGVNTITIPVYWDQIETKQGTPNYSQVDHLIELAQKCGMKVKLHPVVWADCDPDWVDKGYADAARSNPHLSEDQYTKNVVQKHISETLEHFGKKFE